MVQLCEWGGVYDLRVGGKVGEGEGGGFDV